MLVWLQASPENLAAMDIVSRSWDLSGKVANSAPLGRELQRARRLRLTESPDASASARRSRPAWVPAGVVAAVALVSLAAVGWSSLLSLGATYSTPLGRQLSVRLADGTLVTMDGGTRLDVRFDLLHRRVRLVTGEAELDVAKAPWRPFRLDTQYVLVNDRGTRFTVRRREGSVRVVLVRGSVDLLDPRTGKLRAELTPGQQATVAEDGTTSIAQADLEEVLAWREGQMVLKNASIDEALQEIRARTPMEITTHSRALGNLKVSGVYSVSDVVGFMNALTKLYPISWRELGPERFELFPTKRLPNE